MRGVRMPVADYEVAKQSCMTPVISGYTSRLHKRAYGANYMFNKLTYRLVVEHPIASSYPWDDRMSEVRQSCTLHS